MDTAEGKQVFPLASLPESCVAEVFSHMTALEVLQLATVCRSWARASSADNVWETFLPQNFKDLCASAHPEPVELFSLKECYRRLCEGIFLDDGKQKVSLDKVSGSLVTAVSVAGGMEVIWGDHRQYWAMEDNLRSATFPHTAHLLAVCWFQLGGSARIQLPAGKYSFAWRLARDRVFALNARRVGGMLMLPGPGPGRGITFTWRRGVAESNITVAGGPVLEHTVQLDMNHVGEFPNWSEVPVGEVEIEPGVDEQISPLEIHAELSEHKDGNWKSGLYVDALVVRQML